MTRATDTTENIEFSGVVTIIEHPILGAGNGSLEVQGSIYTDSIVANTIGEPVILENIKFIDSTFTIQESITIPVPLVNENKFFIENSLLKSKNSSNVITIYQPTNSKGDLLTHNGNTQIKLPVGSTGNILTADSSTESGLKWVTNTTTNTNTTTSIVLTLIGINKNTTSINKVYGALFSYVSPYIENGGCANFFASKSRDSINGHIIRLNSNPSIISNGNLFSNFNIYSTLDHYKDYLEGDGNYNTITNYLYNVNDFTLSGTNWVQILSDTTGVFSISIENDNDGACATFLICKNNATINTAAITRISSSPSITNTNIQMRWQSNNGIEIRKSSLNEDGVYKVIDNFQNAKSTQITLSSTIPVQLPKSFFRFYKNKSFMLRINSNILNSPKMLVLFSKNNTSTYGNKITINSGSPNLNITWEPNSLLYINKMSNSFDGIYIIDVLNN